MRITQNPASPAVRYLTRDLDASPGKPQRLPAWRLAATGGVFSLASTNAGEPACPNLTEAALAE